MKVLTPLKAIRQNCLECSGGSLKAVTYCSCNGLHSTRCHFWPYRFGRRPKSVKDRRLVMPEAMPPADTPLEGLSEDDLRGVPQAESAGRRYEQADRAKGRIG